jgi:hypothetical protein
MLAQDRILPALDPIEWNTVAIALQDADRSAWFAPEQGSLRSKFGRLYTRLTGNAPARPLADPRLDTLRRFVDATRRTRRVAEQLVPAMIAQGFNRAQVDAIAMLSA